MPSLPAVESARVRAAVVTPASCYREVVCVPETGSTNADLLRAAEAGESAGLVRIAEHQTGGRGRFQRRWVDTPGAGIAMSVLVAPTRPLHAWAWLPLLLGLAVRDGVSAATGAPVLLKWPNDVILDDGPAPGKLCGLLVETTHAGGRLVCVLGAGINVAMNVAELPVPTATSLTLNGYVPDKTEVAIQILRCLDGWYRRFESGHDLRAPYAAACTTIGRRVRVQLDAELGRGDVVEGVAVGVDDSGSLEIRTDGGDIVAISAGDAVHVR